MDHYDVIGIAKLCTLKRADMNNPAKLSNGRWKFADGVVVMPQFPCPWKCGAQLTAMGVWRISGMSYHGGFLIGEEKAQYRFRDDVRHPHTQGSTICWGNAKTLEDWFPGIAPHKSYSGIAETAYFVYRTTGHFCNAKYTHCGSHSMLYFLAHCVYINGFNWFDSVKDAEILKAIGEYEKPIRDAIKARQG